jgi:hypothetical protein
MLTGVDREVAGQGWPPTSWPLTALRKIHYKE